MKSHNWPRILKYTLFIGMLAAGYSYDLTFVPIGLEDFGNCLPGIRTNAFTRDMTLLALLTCFMAIAFGSWMISSVGESELFVLLAQKEPVWKRLRL